jgi:hypothetical protein
MISDHAVYPEVDRSSLHRLSRALDPSADSETNVDCGQAPCPSGTNGQGLVCQAYLRHRSIRLNSGE